MKSEVKTLGDSRWAAVRALAGKDLRLLRPLGFGVAGYLVLGIALQVLFEPADRTLWARLGDDPSGGAADPVFYFLLPMLAALVLLPGERDARTDQFVGTLPVEPRAVFLTKFGLLATLLAAMLTVEFAIDLGIAWLNPETYARRALSGPEPWLSLALHVLLVVIGAAHAVWMTFYGRWAWIILPACLTAEGLLPVYDPGLRRFTLAQLGDLSHVGTQPLVPWSALLVHVPLAALGLALGIRLWMRERQPTVAAVASEGAGSRRRWLLAGAAILAFFAVLALARSAFWTPRLASEANEDDTVAAEEDGAGDAGSTSDGGTVTAAAAADEDRQSRTGRFIFSYRAEDQDEIRAIAALGEKSHDLVQAWLGAPPLEQVIVSLNYAAVDVGGITKGQRLNMDISGESPEGRRALFIHELAHAFHHALSKGARPEQEGTLRFLAEGLATTIEYDLTKDLRGRRESRRRSAWAHGRYRIKVADLLDAPRFLGHYDEKWLYDFGERWIAAMLSTCGRDAPTKLFKRLGDPQLPRALNGTELVRELLHRDACSYDAVEAHYEAGFLPDEAATRGLANVRARFKGAEKNALLFDVRALSPDGAVVPAKIELRHDTATPPADHIGLEQDLVSGETVRLRVEDHQLPGPRFQYRIGFRAPDSDAYTFSRWRSTSMRRALGSDN